MDNFVVVAVGEGVGAGIVIDGNLHRGADGAAGEIGHVPVPGATSQCSCGRFGCLEAVSSDGAVLAYVAEAIAQGEKSSLSGTRPFERAIEVVRVAADEGDAMAAAALQCAGHMLRLGIAALVNLLNPRLVILFRQGALAGPLGWDAAFESLQEHCFAGTDRNMDFFVGSVDDVAWARGAACVLLSQLFSSAGPPFN